MKQYCIMLMIIALLLFSMHVIAGEKVTVKDIKPYFYCAVEMTGSYDQHEDTFTTLYEQAGMQGLGTDFNSFGIYYDDPNDTPVEQLTWELGFALADSVIVNAPLVVKKWDYKKEAGLLYNGSFDSPEFVDAHIKLYEWLGKNNKMPVGPLMEKYMEMPTQNAEGGWVGKIRILLPIEK